MKELLLAKENIFRKRVFIRVIIKTKIASVYGIKISKTPTAPTCLPDEFMCNDGECISKDWACDGVEDCPRGSDENEEFCSTCPFQFLCTNGRCTEKENICDGRNNCRDNSDETQLCDVGK